MNQDDKSLEKFKNYRNYFLGVVEDDAASFEISNSSE